MGRQTGPHYITGTIGDRTYYKLNGQYLVRAKSTLSRRRVKRSPAFRRTMEYAGWLGQASKVAAEVYRMMQREKRKVKVYRKMTGEAMEMIRQGMDVAKVKDQLMQQYLPKAQPVLQPVQVKVPKQKPVVVVRPMKVPRLFSAGQGVVRGRKSWQWVVGSWQQTEQEKVYSLRVRKREWRCKRE